ncbi:hypothetical protein NIES19_33670 [Anabaena cylindrica PCC 7122]|nr:hypothetical protein NIES19_33670 [Anabaena cylindrica PCC 7122]
MPSFSNTVVHGFLTASVSLSTAEVNAAKIKMGGYFSTASAIATQTPQASRQRRLVNSQSVVSLFAPSPPQLSHNIGAKA